MIEPSCIFSFHFISFRFVSFRFVPVRFFSFRFVTFCYVSFHYVSFRFPRCRRCITVHSSFKEYLSILPTYRISLFEKKFCQVRTVLHRNKSYFSNTDVICGELLFPTSYPGSYLRAEIRPWVRGCSIPTQMYNTQQYVELQLF